MSLFADLDGDGTGRRHNPEGEAYVTYEPASGGPRSNTDVLLGCLYASDRPLGAREVRDQMADLGVDLTVEAVSGLMSNLLKTRRVQRHRAAIGKVNLYEPLEEVTLYCPDGHLFTAHGLIDSSGFTLRDEGDPSEMRCPDCGKDAEGMD